MSSKAQAQLLLLSRVLVALLFLLPLLWMLTAALHPPGRPLPTSLWPSGITWTNFGRVGVLVPFGHFLRNSLLVAALATPLTVLTASWAGLGMALLPRASQQRWVILSLAVLMVPGVALWTTRFVLYKELGWLDSVLALIAPAWMGTTPFYVLMFYRAFRRIPAALYEAARLDGAHVGQMWWLVAWPLVRPTAVAVAMLSFLFYWGDFVSPLLYLQGDDLATLPLALQLLQQMSRSDWPLLMAAAVLTTAVPILLFILIQPYLTRLTATKGNDL